MAYSNLLRGLHDGSELTESETGLVKLNSTTRTFEFPEGYNKVIAYEGDINSQFITFEMPTTHEGHQLKNCAHKKVRWYNVGSGAEGTTELLTNKDKTQLTWEVPPAVFTKAGQIQFSFTFYDIKDGQVYFSWNSAICSELSVAATLNNVGIPAETHSTFIPAKDEVLIINDETRMIVAPTGYNNLVCNYGDVGVSTVYFRVKRYIRGIDLLDENTKITITYYYEISGHSHKGSMSSEGTEGTGVTVTPYSVPVGEDNYEELIMITWNIPEELSHNNEKYSGVFNIFFELEKNNKKWSTNSYSKLTIGDSFYRHDNSDVDIGVDEEIVYDGGDASRYYN
jgi:hypothetical protein